MSRQQKFSVTDQDGVRGTVLTTSRFLDDSPQRLIRLADGRELIVPKQLLRPQDDGSFILTTPIADLMGDNAPRTSQEQVVPVIQEQLNVGKRVTESGRVRINKRIETTESVVDEPLLHHSYDIQRIAVNRIAEDVPEPRYEGDTLVLPILEEVLVVEKRLILREEVRITPKREEVHDPQTHSVRREHVEVERVS